MQCNNLVPKYIYDVSVLITTCDRHALCDRAVASVFAQNFTGTIEILIIDDGSLQPYSPPPCKSDNMIVRLLRNEHRLGQSASKNMAITKAKGRYLTGLDDDDYFTSNRIQVFMANSHLLCDGHFSGLYSDCIITGIKKSLAIRYPRTATYSRLTWSNCVGNQIFAKADTLKDKHMFNEKMLCLEDWELWIRLAKDVAPLFNVSISSIIVDSSHGLHRVTSDTPGERFRSASQAISRLMPKLAKRNLDINIMSILVRQNPSELNLRRLAILLFFLKVRTLKYLLILKLNQNLN
jgi:glycosyltransferase involved in cell wall biosynthesis